MVVVVIGKSRQGFLLNVEAKYVQQSFLFDLGDFFVTSQFYLIISFELLQLTLSKQSLISIDLTYPDYKCFFSILHFSNLHK